MGTNSVEAPPKQVHQPERPTVSGTGRRRRASSRPWKNLASVTRSPAYERQETRGESIGKLHPRRRAAREEYTQEEGDNLAGISAWPSPRKSRVFFQEAALRDGTLACCRWPSNAGVPRSKLLRQNHASTWARAADWLQTAATSFARACTGTRNPARRCRVWGSLVLRMCNYARTRCNRVRR